MQHFLVQIASELDLVGADIDRFAEGSEHSQLDVCLLPLHLSSGTTPSGALFSFCARAIAKANANFAGGLL